MSDIQCACETCHRGSSIVVEEIVLPAPGVLPASRGDLVALAHHQGLAAYLARAAMHRHARNRLP